MSCSELAPTEPHNASFLGNHNNDPLLFIADYVLYLLTQRASVYKQQIPHKHNLTSDDCFPEKFIFLMATTSPVTEFFA